MTKPEVLLPAVLPATARVSAVVGELLYLYTTQTARSPFYDVQAYVTRKDLAFEFYILHQ